MEDTQIELPLIEASDMVSSKLLTSTTDILKSKNVSMGLSVNQIMKNIQKNFEKIFPNYLETGYEIRDAVLDECQNMGFCLCATGTIVKVTKGSRLFKTIIIPDYYLNNLAMNKKCTFLFASSKQGKIFEINTITFQKTRKFTTNFLNLKDIYYHDPENKIHCISENCIFELSLAETSEESVTKTLFEGEFTNFKFIRNEWLLGYKNGVIKRIDKDSNEFQRQFVGEIGKVKYSRSSKIILALVSSFAYLMDMNLDIKKKYELESMPQSIMMTNDDKFMVVATEDGKIAIIDILSDLLITIPVHQGKIIRFFVDSEIKTIVSFGQDSKIGIFNMPDHKTTKVLNTRLSDFVFFGTKDELFFVENNKTIKKWDFIGNIETVLYSDAEEISDPLHYIPTKHQLVFSDTYRIIFFNINSNSVDFILPLKGKVILTMIKSDIFRENEPKYLFTLASENNFVYVYDLNKKSLHGYVKGHGARVICLINIPKTTQIVTAGNDKKIMI